MIWYLLYPLRGTTEAPVLAQNHPLRTAFAQYGTWTARNVKTVLPLSVACIFFVLYPAAFLYTTDSTNITSGVSNLPHHVWTDAKPLDDGVVVEPDVIMRSIWIHGSYMKALDRDVLLGALEVQDELLGPTVDFNPRRSNGSLRDNFHIINGLTNQSWFFHSPLQYWSGSSDEIIADQDIISTVNAKKTQSTSVNVTLRHSIVFSGKRFEERRLVAADALVVTLIHLRDSPVGRQWIRNAEKLALQRTDKWTFIPEDGKSMSSQLYEFQFLPMSGQDWLSFVIAYSITFLYLMLTLSKLRALKSRFGLMITILAQIAASIGSSFTLCAIFKIDLSRIPYYMFPITIFAISIENSFRLINAVIMTSSTISIGGRIGEAFGTTAHVAIANRVQLLLILILLSWVTHPGVAALCYFTAFATAFDFFYLATFFLSVLSVDLRQRELSELERSSHRKGRSQSLGWLDQIRRIRLGEAAVSTRIAGTIVVLGFVLIAQSHYAPESGRRWLNWMFSSAWRNSDEGAPKSSLLVDIHQARSPTSWLRLQDHETAREVIKIVKPLAHSYVACVYDPLVLVLKGSDRIPHSREPFFLPAVYDFIHHEIPRFLVFILTVGGLFYMFTNSLIRDEVKHPGEPDHPDDEPLLLIRPLKQGHALDIAMMTASPDGQLVSVGFDRLIQIWDVPSGSRTSVMSDAEYPAKNPFPVLGIAINDSSKWLAMLSWQKVMLWSIKDQRWESTMEIDLGGQKPETLFFHTNGTDSIPSLVVVKRNGVMVELQFEFGKSTDFIICRTPLAWAVSFTERSSANQNITQPSILTASRKNCIHLVRPQGTGWTSTEVRLTEQRAKDVHILIPLPDFSMYLIGRSRSVDLVDLDSSTIIHTFETEPMQPRSLGQISLARSPQSGLTSLTLAYLSSETGDLVIQTYLPEGERDSLCSYSSSETQRRSWGNSKMIPRRIGNPGAWEALSNGSIVGVRQTEPTQKKDERLTASGLRRRVINRSENHHHSAGTTDKSWAVWVIYHLETKGSTETTPLDAPDAEDDDPSHLMISQLGPMVKLGTASVAVGFGNVVKVVSVGHEHFDRYRNRPAADDLNNLIFRRRKAVGAPRVRIP
ncbi:sterol-sensing domain of SREBP cleavage-activation-domain-containing protein [Bombardia bombarda]|uniref:Sterol regulatory element-binding protein cleavage-activating protein n=1 Tax=Bombardia bombarda TaxID=252184 RepID=A0AA40BW83_9PEZI|nr:sterol-sensing domain of SREBP cleavage-activation-domain-containing protein [Bombardia bombarda]